MKLKEFIATNRKAVHEDLLAGHEPTIGTFDAESLKEARTKGSPQLGAVLLEPHRIRLEFIFPALQANTSIFTVTIDTPERIVFMPVPTWVIESIWQGEIDGSYWFESEARCHLRNFEELLNEPANAELFCDKRMKRKE